jgi:flavin-dependent dehydrogenase
MHYHTIIIGGGPGGLTCAATLARKGVRVLLLERNHSIGTKVCAGGITWSGLARNIPERLIEKHFPRQYIHSARQRVRLSSPHPIISTINREKMGQWMAEEATIAGADIQTNIHVHAITDHEVITDSTHFSYDFLVGADGSNSLVRRHLNLPTESIGIGFQYHIPGNYPKMIWHLDQKLFNTGYAWIFPHKDKASVGAYSCRKDLTPRALRENLHHWMEKCGIKRQGAKPEAATINFDYRGYDFGNRFLVGDAAGLASGLTGEGIYPAVLSGDTVAQRILNPTFDDSKLSCLIKKQKSHSRLLHLTGSNKIICKIILESLVAALRLRLVNFDLLEMG